MRVVVVSQGNLARELLAAAATITGETKGFEALCLGWNEDLESGRRRLAEILTHPVSEETVDDGEVLLLADMYGGTPFNVASSFRQPGKVEVLAGVNLPMLVRLGCRNTPQQGLKETASWLVEKGRSAICQCAAPARPQQPCGEGS